jgi:hypothetical protein
MGGCQILILTFIAALAVERESQWFQAGLHGIIEDRKASDEQVAQAIQGLGKVVEPYRFWARIANDGSYSAKRRGICALQLFKRHITSGMTLQQVGQRLMGANWLHAENVFHFIVLGGHVPVQGCLNEHDVFSMLIPGMRGEDAIYITVKGKGLSQVELVRAFKTGKVEPNIGNRVLLDVWPRPPRNKAAFKPSKD